LEYGMWSELGPQAYARSREESRFLPGVVVQSNERVFSEETAERVDGELTAMLRQLYERALAILSHNRRYLEELAQALLNEEVLEGDRIRGILHGASLPPAFEEEVVPAPAH